MMSIEVNNVFTRLDYFILKFKNQKSLKKMSGKVVVEMGEVEPFMGSLGTPLNSPKGMYPSRVHPWAHSKDKRVIDCPTSRTALLDELEKRMLTEKVEAIDPNHDIVFNNRTFIYEALSHIFQPFSLPFNIYFEGYTGAQNKIFIASCSSTNALPPNFIIQAFPLLMMGVITCYLLLDIKELKVDVALAIILYLYRCVIIGTKYAFYPPAEYHAMKNGDVDISRHLVASWFFCTNDLLNEELRLAQLRKDIDLEKQVFYVRKPDSLPNDSESAGHLYKVRASDVMERLCDYALYSTQSSTKKIGKYGKLSNALLVACLWSPIPPFNYSGLRWEHYVIKVFTTLIILFCWVSMYTFLMAGVVHYHRLYSIMQTTMWAVGLTPPPGGRVITDKISLQIPVNSYTWFHCRLVALDIGKRFEMRITFYVSVALILLTAAVLAVALAALSGYIFDTQVLAVVITIAAYVAVSLGAVLACAARANSIQRYHAGLIAVEKLRVRSLNYDSNDSLVDDHVETVCRALAEIKRGLEGAYDLSPVRVFGIRANYELLGQFVTTFGTAAAFGFRLLITNQK